MKKIIASFSVVTGILLLMSCPSPGTGPGASGGSLTINLPPTGMQDPKNPDLTIVDSYDLLGTGPGGGSFQRSGIKAHTVTIDSLAAGRWDVEVNGNNLNNKVISTTTAHVTVVGGSTASTDVLVNQLASSSGLSISLTWANALNDAFVEARLTPLGGSPVTINLPPGTSVGGNTTISATRAFAPGYYVLSRVFKGTADGFLSGGADSLYVPPADNASFILVVDPSGATVTMTPDTSKTIPISFSGVKTVYGKGQEINISATPGVPKAVFQWYLNGSLQAPAGSTAAFSKLPAGAYRLDCVVSSNGVLSSDHVTFSVTGN